MPDFYWKTAGHCTRCGEPFAPGAMMHIVMERVVCQVLDLDVKLAIHVPEAVPVCEACLEPREQAERWVDRTCGGCGHVMRFYLTPWRPDVPLELNRPCRPRAWCSSRCEQRVRRTRRKIVHQKSCASCQKPFVPARRVTANEPTACRIARL